jgi:outer membrane protein assembly factor BamB
MLLPTLVCFIPAGAAIANEWPQYRGPAGDGIASEAIAATWPSDGPRRLWTANTPAGFSSLSAAEGKVFTIVAREVEGALSEVCISLDAASGKELWAAATGLAKYRGGGDSGAEGNTGGDGPRSTPAVSGGCVYVYSATLVLSCLDAASGKILWKKDIIGEFGGQNIGWESALSPVVDGERVYVAGGGAGRAMLAFNKRNGELLWKAGDETLTHATPVVAEIHGVHQVVFFMQSGLVALEATSGKALWKFPFPYRTSTACSPVISGDIVFCTAGYGIGGAACRVNKKDPGFEAVELWRAKGDNQAASLWSTPVCKDGYLYGMISFKKFGRGPLKCLDIKTGEVKWEQAGYGAGNVILAGDRLIALADNGEIALVEASPHGYKELARAKGVAGKCWSSPALSDGRLYVRSTKEAACFEVGR